MIHQRPFILKFFAVIMAVLTLTSTAHAEESEGWLGSVTGFVSDIGSRVGQTINTAANNYLIAPYVDSQIAGTFTDEQLAEYFPTEEERAQAIARVNEVSAPYNGSAVQKVKSGTDELVRVIVGRVFDKENIRSQEQKTYWQQQLAKDFDQCIGNVATVWGAGTCAGDLKAQLPEKLGRAVVYATAYEDMASKDSAGQPSTRFADLASGRYDVCYKEKKSEKNVINKCARQSLFATIRDYAQDSTNAVKTENGLDLNDHFESAARGRLDQCLSAIDSNVCDFAVTDGMAASTCIPMTEVRAHAKSCGLEYKKSVAADVAKKVMAKDQETMKKLKANMSTEEVAKIQDNLGQRVSDCISDASMSAEQAKPCIAQAQLDTRKEAGVKIADNTIDRTFDKAAKDVKGAAGEETKARIEASKEDYKKAFQDCIAKSNSEEAFKYCTEGDFKKMTERNAAKDLGVAVGEGKIKELLHAKENVPEYDKIKSSYEACLKTKSISTQHCLDNYKASLTKLIASVRVKYELGQVVGKDGLAKKSKDVNAMLTKFNQCVDSAKVRYSWAGSETMSSIKSSMCSSELNKAGTEFTKTALAEKLTNKQDSKQTKELKKDIAGNMVDTAVAAQPGKKDVDIYAASKNLPQQGEFDSATTNALKSYVDYNPQQAAAQTAEMKETVAEAVASGNKDNLKQTMAEKMDSSGASDQLIKSLIRQEVKEGLMKLKGEDRIDPKTMSKLLDPKNFDRIFTKDVLDNLQAKDKLLKPLLVEGKNPNDPEVKKAKAELKKKIAETLVKSDDFGSMVASATIQKKINQQDEMTKFFARAFYGDNALDWKRVRNTPRGQQAEEYIKNQIVLPMMTNSLPESERRARVAKAKSLIESAITGKAPASVDSGSSSGSGRYRNRSSGDMISCQLTNSCGDR